MVKTLNPAARRALSQISDDLNAAARHLAEHLLADAHEEDLLSLPDGTLGAAMALSARTLAAHQAGRSLIETESAGSIHGRPATVISVVNDNKPFLFDSVLGEINETAPDVVLVVHPVLDVQHSSDGFEVIDKSRPGMAREETLRTSVICVIVAGLDEQQTKALRGRILAILDQVAAAVRDWPAMLERMDTIVEELERGVLPTRKTDLAEALEFLKWLHDDNFTFLGIREYDYVGGEKQGQLNRADKPGLGIDEGIILGTFFMLVGAIVLVYMANQTYLA